MPGAFRIIAGLSAVGAAAAGWHGYTQSTQGKSFNDCTIHTQLKRFKRTAEECPVHPYTTTLKND
jgi:hypothetical protein